MMLSLQGEHPSASVRSPRLSIWIALLLLVAATADGRIPSKPEASFGRASSIVDSTTTTTTTKTDATVDENETDHPKSSFFSVDPSKLLSTILNHAGLLIPDSIENDLNIMAKVCSVEMAELNILERRLILRNFTVSSPHVDDDRHTLRVGKVHMRWDSYLKPCLEIEVEDVHFVVEFTNLVLTRNNWHELQEQGFPPALLTDYSDNSTDFTAHLRIGSLDFSGNLTAEIRSRPLDADIHLLTFDLDKLDDFNLRIHEVAKKKPVARGRRGVTMEELYDMLNDYFHDKIVKFLSSRLHDLTHNPVTESKVVQEVGHFFKEATNTIRNYTIMAKNHKQERLHKLVSAKFSKWGLTLPPIDELQVQASRLNSNLKDLSKERWKAVRVAFVNADNKLKAFWKRQRGDDKTEEEFFFPDW